MNKIGRFILDCLYWAVFFDESYGDANPVDKAYAPMKSTIGMLIIFAVALLLMALAALFYRKIMERKKRKTSKSENEKNEQLYNAERKAIHSVDCTDK